jgi:hypothetical protein
MTVNRIDYLSSQLSKPHHGESERGEKRQHCAN